MGDYSTTRLQPMQLSKHLFTMLFVLSATFLFSQRTISGVVTDEDGLGLPGVSIIETGTTNGTITDLDGNYSVRVPEGSSLTFSFVGYAAQTIAIGDQSTIDLAMVPDAEILDEIVVTGYTAQSKRNVTGAVASVEVDEVVDLPVNSIEQAMQGRVAGVNITSSGAPGSGANIRIRGYGTINNNDPLYIVDGVPTRGGLNEINPSDIKSIQVLKDASAASIYGARAGNGVIIITTKNGSVDGSSTLTLDATYGVQSVSNLPELMNPQQLADYIWELQRNAGQPFSHGQYGTGNTPVLPQYINGDPSQPYDAVNNAITRAATGAGTNWMEEIFDSAPMTNINIGAQGGGQNGQYALSAGYLSQEVL